MGFSPTEYKLVKALPFESPSEYRVHMFTSDSRSFLTNAFLIETQSSVIAIDAMMTRSDAEKLHQEVEAIGKPLAALLITHPHPDHYNGSAILVHGMGKVPIISTFQVRETIENLVDVKEAKWKPIFGDDWPSHRALPNQYVNDREILFFDGVPFVTVTLGPGESLYDVSWIVGTQRKVIFVGDVVFNGLHSFMNDGRGREWLATLDRLKVITTEVELIFTGHGQPGSPTETILAQRTYIIEYYQKVQELLQANQQLSSHEKDQLFLHMKSVLPQDGLDFFITAGADAVASAITQDAESNFWLTCS